ncbi:MAG: tetratricopeptide repeat protein [Armatimonadetes bacterium]|nr:tetratricopeptide repeat protein [Armatimonadota bacterium]
MGIVLSVIMWSAARAQSEIPATSLIKLQELFGGVRDRLWEINDDFWHRGQFERCIAVLRLIAAMDPHDTDAYANGAWLMQNQYRDDEAEAFLIKCLANNPDVYESYWELGYFYYMHERFGEAIENLEKAVAFDVPEFVWHLLAHAYEHDGDVGTALTIWFRQEAAEPENVVPRIQIDRILSGGRPPKVLKMSRPM